MLKAVILVGGPQKGKASVVQFRHQVIFISSQISHSLPVFVIFFIGTRFRPLSLDLPKPLFPIAGRSIIQHHIEACVQLTELKEILVIGYYPAAQMEKFVSDMQTLYNVSIR